jgi:hypothetical protein
VAALGIVVADGLGRHRRSMCRATRPRVMDYAACQWMRKCHPLGVRGRLLLWQRMCRLDEPLAFSLLFLHGTKEVSDQLTGKGGSRLGERPH